MGARFGIGVFAIIWNENGEVLLVRQTYGNHHWTFPGGAVEKGESVDRAVIREVWEETHLHVKIDGVTGIYSRPALGRVVICFRCSFVSGFLRPSPETLSCRYFSPTALPTNQPVSPDVPMRIADALAWTGMAVLRTH